MNPLLAINGVKNLDNLHLIAISNLKHKENQLQRWFSGKYKTPPKAYEQYTNEELIVEMLEDFYESNVSEQDRFLDNLYSESEWDGEMPDDYEREMKPFFDKNQVDISKYQSGEQLTAKQEDDIIASLGKNLPKSKVSPKSNGERFLGEGEFEESF